MVKELTRIKKEFQAKRHKGTQTIYLAGGWFSPKQIDLLVTSYRELCKNPGVRSIHVPILHQYEGSNPIVNGKFDPDLEWSLQTFQNDLNAMDNSDLAIILLDPSHADSGTCYESGYCRKAGVLTVGCTAEPLSKDAAINLMPAISSVYWTTPKDLSTIDLYHLDIKPYKGKLI